MMYNIKWLTLDEQLMWILCVDDDYIEQHLHTTYLTYKSVFINERFQ